MYTCRGYKLWCLNGLGDNSNSSAFWAALKIQPILQSPVQTWKALIVVVELDWMQAYILGSQSYARRTQIRAVSVADRRYLTLVDERASIKLNGSTASFERFFSNCSVLIEIVEHWTYIWTADIYVLLLSTGQNSVSPEPSRIQYVFVSAITNWPRRTIWVRRIHLS